MMGSLVLLGRQPSRDSLCAWAAAAAEAAGLAAAVSFVDVEPAATFAKTLEEAVNKGDCLCLLDMTEEADLSRLAFGIAGEKGVPFIQYYPLLPLGLADRYIHFETLWELHQKGLSDWSLPLLVCLSPRKEEEFATLLGQEGDYQHVWSWGYGGALPPSRAGLRQSPLSAEAAAEELDSWLKGEGIALCILENTGRDLESRLVWAARLGQRRLLVLEKRPPEPGILLSQAAKLPALLKQCLT